MKPIHLYLVGAAIASVIFLTRQPAPVIHERARPIYIVSKPIRFYTTSSNINFNTDGALMAGAMEGGAIIHINDGEEGK